ncbi:YiiD C-terminal domain-containing protein [Bdellovibrio svalbardensis]|uniref:YiiD C-terminal domain-containing protein n=1 Tax=Bdellovibrio svalbardensis TaxID=2972972 RepID=A0ABT6DEF6_9BACT|nr:YiiD C-terminal domain-containing protein [Bdellovibrio svalbardensis]MDG0815213.1 YiiD C-terminal domain-containing protein [Bdellovibrio svalbardensis]
MNQQWLTILMSKGIELEQNLHQQLQHAKDGLKTQLEDRGIRLSAADLAALLEEVSPKASHAALSYALDIVRPFSAGMGLRISRLSDTQVEMVVPARTRNLNDANTMHEGAITTAAIEAAKLLWMRHAPLGNFEITVTRIEADFFKVQNTECRLRMELPETTREVVLAELRDQRETSAEAEVKVFDEHDQAVGGIIFQLKFKHTPALT